MQDRIYIKASYREFLGKIHDDNFLGFRMPDAKDIFLLGVSLGLNDPKQISGKKDGYFQLANLQTYDKAFYGSITIGNLKDEKELDKYANEEINYNEAEKCAETGLDILRKKIDDANGDEELFAKRMISEMDLLYERYFRS